MYYTMPCAYIASATLYHRLFTSQQAGSRMQWKNKQWYGWVIQQGNAADRYSLPRNLMQLKASLDMLIFTMAPFLFAKEISPRN